MKPINFFMGLILIGAGAYALYLTIVEQRTGNRPNLATRIMRAGVGLVAIIGGALAILSATGFIFGTPTPYAIP